MPAVVVVLGADAAAAVAAVPGHHGCPVSGSCWPFDRRH